jgi:Ca-activated chloride channel homolog
MVYRVSVRVLLLLTVSTYGFTQAGLNQQLLESSTPGMIEQQRFDDWFMRDDYSSHDGTPVVPPDSVSKLDLMAPGKARSEYTKGFADLYRKNFNGAAAHFEKAVAIFPKYVSAHNALGTAYMNLSQNEKARTEFQTAVSLDDHLPFSSTNLALACIAVKDYPAAAQAIQKASATSPLDMKLRVILAYVQLMNQDYPGVLSTAQQVHQQKHGHAAMVHYFAASAYQLQHNLDGMQSELQIFLQEDPKAPNAESARQTLAKMEEIKNNPPPAQTTITYETDASQPVAAPGSMPAATRNALARFKLQSQVESAECENCPTADADPGPNNSVKPVVPYNFRPRINAGWTLRSSVDEVGVFFAATDNGKAVCDLHAAEVKVLDDRKTPAAVLDFRNESQLPLRLGFVIDTSSSITNRFSFEQDAAKEFLEHVLTNDKDRAFVVGVANSVLMVQDFTGSKDAVSSALHKLAPAGGTALWDAVTFAAEKLGDDREATPVAKILVVVSDGEDNSSTVTLREVLETSQHEQVIVYAVSTNEDSWNPGLTPGDRALKALAQQTGGTVFFPGSMARLNRSLNELQQVIRSRYLISYKPAEFVSDGSYRSIQIDARKQGHKLRIYTRKGYFAGTSAVKNQPAR